MISKEQQPVLKFTPEQSEMIEGIGNRYEDYYNLPQWFKKVGFAMYQEISSENLPEAVKQIVIDNPIVKEYADAKSKKISIEFNDFIKDNHYTKNEEKGWYQYQQIREDFPAGFSMMHPVYHYLTIDQIFELYLQKSKNNQ